MSPLKPSDHPNAVIGGIGGGLGLGTLVVWALNRFADASLDPAQAALVAGGVATLVLFVGRRGIRGLARKLWRGDNGNGGSE